MSVKPDGVRAFLAAALAVAMAGSSACQDREAPRPPSAGKLRVTFPEMSAHGTAIVVQTPSGAVYLVDAGNKEKEQGYDAGRDTIAPFLLKEGVKDVQAIVLSHPHGDHYGGASYLIKRFRVKRFVESGYDGPGVGTGYPKVRALLAEERVETRVVRAGDKLSWDEALEVTVLSPPKEGIPSADEDRCNNNSLVLRVRHGKNVFLLPGDIKDEGCDYLLRTYGADTLKTTVLAVPHHGFFSARRFAETAKPEIAVASCLADYPNKKIHSPGQVATDLLGPLGAKVFVTAWHGTVEIVSDGETYSVKTEREKK